MAIFSKKLTALITVLSVLLMMQYYHFKKNYSKGTENSGTNFLNKKPAVNNDELLVNYKKENLKRTKISIDSRPPCGCSRTYKPISLDTRTTQDRSWARKNSTCSDYSTVRGKGQKVVSYTLYGNFQNKSIFEAYYQELEKRVHEVDQKYSGWIMRLYHDFTEKDAIWKDACSIYCKSPHLDLCSVSNLPSPLDSISGSNMAIMTKSIWRFLAFVDPLVDVTISRDIDSRILHREVDAVAEWMNSDASYHVMRDHPSHYAEILAGMWGAKVFQDRKPLRWEMEVLFSSPKKAHKRYDQELLATVIWPHIRKHCMVHDSYHCQLKKFRGKPNLPFPSQRQEGTFVGDTKKGANDSMIIIKRKKCPIKCRPKNHKEWKFC